MQRIRVNSYVQEREGLSMSENILTNSLRYAVYERLFDSSNLIAVFDSAEDAEEYREYRQKKNHSKNTDYYTKRI